MQEGQWIAPKNKGDFSINPNELSILVLNAPGNDSVNEGQPVPLSNFAFDEKSFDPQLAQ